jgi:hypothetical protein
MLITPRLLSSLAALGLITAWALPSSAADVTSPPSQVAEQTSTSKEAADSPTPPAQVAERTSTAKEAVDSSTPSLQMAERTMADRPIPLPPRKSGRISAIKKAFDSPSIVDARPQPRAIFEHYHAATVPVILGVAY